MQQPVRALADSIDRTIAAPALKLLPANRGCQRDLAMNDFTTDFDLEFRKVRGVRRLAPNEHDSCWRL